MFGSAPPKLLVTSTQQAAHAPQGKYDFLNINTLTINSMGWEEELLLELNFRTVITPT